MQLQSGMSGTLIIWPIDVPSYMNLLQFGGVDIKRSHIRYEMYLRVDKEHSKTFSNVVLVSKLSILITSHIFSRCCQIYFEQILPICSICLYALFWARNGYILVLKGRMSQILLKLNNEFTFSSSFVTFSISW